MYNPKMYFFFLYILYFGKAVWAAAEKFKFSRRETRE